MHIHITSSARPHSLPSSLPPAPYASPVFCVPDVVVHPPQAEQTSLCAPFLAFAPADARPAPGPSTPELACAAARLNIWQASSSSSSHPTPRRSAFHLPRPATALGIFPDPDWPAPYHQPEPEPETPVVEKQGVAWVGPNDAFAASVTPKTKL